MVMASSACSVMPTISAPIGSEYPAKGARSRTGRSNRYRSLTSFVAIAPRPGLGPEVVGRLRGRGVKLIASNNREGSRPLLAGAGGVGLQRPDTFGECAAAFGSRGGGAIAGGVVGGFCHLRRNRRVGGGQHGLDRRIRPFELHREFCHLGGAIVGALASH